MASIPDLPDPDASSYYIDGRTANDTVEGAGGNRMNPVTTGNGTYFGELWRGWQRVHLRIHQRLGHLWQRWQ